MRVYTKKAEFAELIQEGYNAILSRLQKQSFPEDVDEYLDVMVPSPSATVAPMTPKASGSRLHSRNPSYTFVGVGTPFEPNKFTAIKNRSASPTRGGPELELESTPMATNPSPSPAPGKRKRVVEGRQDEGSSQKTKKKR
jgi:hypothetical protein